VVLFDHIIQIFHLPDDNAGAVCLVVALDRGFIRGTAVNRDLLGDSMTADRWLGSEMMLPSSRPRRTGRATRIAPSSGS
jgi:hypothetical protein